MPANIPTPIVGAGGGQQRNPLETLLLSLVGSLGQQAIGSLFRPETPQSVPQQALESEQDFAMQQLVFRAAGAGDANVSTSDLNKTALKGVAAGKKTAPQNLALIQEEDKSKAREEALAAAEASLQQVGGDNASTLLGLFRFSTQAAAAGHDVSTINNLMRSQLPPDASTELALQETRLKIIDAENQQAADGFGTAELMRLGVLPEGTPLIPGAGDTLLSIVDARDGKKIDWQQEAVDYITSRVGESAGGTGGFPFAPDASGNLVPVEGGGAVTVEQATSEWLDIINTLAPEADRKDINRLLNTNAFQRKLTISMVSSEVVRSMAAGVPDAQIRDDLVGSFSPSVIESILTRARQQISGFNLKTNPE